MTTKFCYIRDYRCPERVLTIARCVENQEVFFGYAINNVVDIDLSTIDERARGSVAYSLRADPNDHTAFLVGSFVQVLDKFDKKQGRTIAEGRLAKKPHVTYLEGNESPLKAVMRAMATFDISTFKEEERRSARCAKRLAKFELALMSIDEEEGDL